MLTAETNMVCISLLWKEKKTKTRKHLIVFLVTADKDFRICDAFYVDNLQCYHSYEVSYNESTAAASAANYCGWVYDAATMPSYIFFVIVGLM